MIPHSAMKSKRRRVKSKRRRVICENKQNCCQFFYIKTSNFQMEEMENKIKMWYDVL